MGRCISSKQEYPGRKFCIRQNVLCIFIFIAVQVLKPPGLFGDEIFQNFEISTKTLDFRSYDLQIELENDNIILRMAVSDLSVRCGPYPLCFSNYLLAAEYAFPDNAIHLTAGMLSQRGISGLIRNPLSGTKASDSMIFFGLPGSDAHFPALQLSLPSMLLASSFFPNGQFRNFGIILHIVPGMFSGNPTGNPTGNSTGNSTGNPTGNPPGDAGVPGAAASPPASSTTAAAPFSLRIISQVENWEGAGRDDLLHNLWMPGNRVLLNNVLAVKTQSSDIDTQISENLNAYAGLQVSLHPEIPYVVNPPSWWLRLNWQVKGKIPYGFGSPLEDSISWNVAVRGAYLSESYLRSGSGSDPDSNYGIDVKKGRFVKFEGRMDIKNSFSTYISFLEKWQDDTRIVLGVEGGSNLLKGKLNVEYRPNQNNFSTLIAASIGDVVRSEIDFKILWEDLQPYFDRMSASLVLTLPSFVLETGIWGTNDAEQRIDFLPSPFDIMVGMELRAALSIDRPTHQFTLEYSMRSPGNIFFDRILYGAEPRAFLEGWEFNVECSLKN